MPDRCCWLPVDVGEASGGGFARRRRGAGRPANVTDAAELLMRCDRAEDAAELLENVAAVAGEPRLLRVLSAAQMLCGRWEPAWPRSTARSPRPRTMPNTTCIAGTCLWRLGDVAGAAAAFEQAARLDPAGPDVRRAQMSLYLAAGLITEATAAGGELLHRFPDDKPTAEAVLHLLHHRLETIDGDYVVLGERDDRAPRPPRRAPGWLDRLRSQRRVIRALIIRETRTRFADHRLGYGWAVIEPVLHIALLSATFAVLMQGRPPIGTHFFIFYYTGLIPYHVFVHTSAGMSHAITSNGAAAAIAAGHHLRCDRRARPARNRHRSGRRGDPVGRLWRRSAWRRCPTICGRRRLALLVTAALGCGLGFVNAVVTVFCRSWDKAYGQVTRILYFVSGIFYVPGMMPDWARDMLAWNPLLHAIDWFRAGFFASYQPHWLDRSYLVILAILALLVGLGLQRGLRRKLSVPL